MCLNMQMEHIKIDCLEHAGALCFVWKKPLESTIIRFKAGLQLRCIGDLGMYSLAIDRHLR